MQAATYLVYTCEHLNKPQEVLSKVFGDQFATLAVETTQLIRIQQQARAAQQLLDDPAVQHENVRKMLLAFSRDLRVVLLRLASRGCRRRYYAASKQPIPPSLARESLHVFAPLANRLWHLADQVGAGRPGLSVHRARDLPGGWRLLTKSAPSVRPRWPPCA